MSGDTFTVWPQGGRPTVLRMLHVDPAKDWFTVETCPFRTALARLLLWRVR